MATADALDCIAGNVDGTDYRRRSVQTDSTTLECRRFRLQLLEQTVLTAGTSQPGFLNSCSPLFPCPLGISPPERQ